MKKLLLVMAAGTFAFALNAQVTYKKNAPIEVKYSEPNDAVITNAPMRGDIYDMPRRNNKASYSSTVLGNTYYDLQTNSTVQDRLVMNSNGDMSAVWTASEENSTSFTDRGTGYAHYDPGTQVWSLDNSYPRIESDRCGWPSLMYDGSGGELVVAHSTASNVLKLNKRSSIGTGSWTEKNVSNTHLTWNRSAMGGSDGNTLHIIAATDTADWANHQNMYRAIVYYRSQDAGSTFDIVDSILPGIDSAAYGASRTNSSKSTMAIDAYAIAAKGNVVAFAIFNRWNDVILMKSTDNGSTWTKTIALDFPYKNFDELDNLCDSSHRHITTDNSGAILIDDNNVVHLSWGQSEVRNNDIDDDGSFFLTPFTDSLGYWNENMGAGNWTTAGYFVDKNNNNTIDVGNLGDYFQGAWLSYPNMSVGSDGSVYIAYSGLSEDTVWASDFNTGMRHIYLVRSKDGGMTWEAPCDLTPQEPDLSESVYPDMLPTTDNKVRLIYQYDWHPSVYVPQITNPANPQNYTRQSQATLNDIVYLEVDTGSCEFSIGYQEYVNMITETEIYPNPSNGQVSLALKAVKDVDANISITDLSGQVVFTQPNMAFRTGRNQVDLDLSQLSKGLYFVNISTANGRLTEKLVLK